MTNVEVNEEAVNNPTAKPLHIHAEPKKDPAGAGWRCRAGLVLSRASYQGEWGASRVSASRYGTVAAVKVMAASIAAGGSAHAVGGSNRGNRPSQLASERLSDVRLWKSLPEPRVGSHSVN